jgi:hypothetical protein
VLVNVDKGNNKGVGDDVLDMEKNRNSRGMVWGGNVGAMYSMSNDSLKTEW